LLAAASIEEAAVETLLTGADMFLVCQKEESVWRAFEAVYKQAERDRKFARLITEKSRHVLVAKRRSQALKTRLSPVPTQKTVDRLRRRIWEFSEEVRANSLLLVEVSS
jgi:beta-glucosidase-like glycosyl hydrolase